MSEPELPAPTQLPATTTPRPMPRRSDDRTARMIAAVALAITAVATWIAIDARVSVRAIESTVGGRLSELGAESAGAKITLAQAQAALKESQARIAELETRAADTQEQRVALEEMYRELSRSADDRLLSEVEQLLVLASQQLQLAANVRGALVALQAADQRLARAEKLAATPLRRAITQDMERLKAVPQVDTVGLAVKIDGLIAQTDALPLIIADAAGPRGRGYRDPERPARGARPLGRDEGAAHPRPRNDRRRCLPVQSYFLRRIGSCLLAARVALVARDEAASATTCAPQAWIPHASARAKNTAAPR